MTPYYPRPSRRRHDHDEAWRLATGGMTQRQIAAALGVSRTAVKEGLYRRAAQLGAAVPDGRATRWERAPARVAPPKAPKVAVVRAAAAPRGRAPTPPAPPPPAAPPRPTLPPVPIRAPAKPSAPAPTARQVWELVHLRGLDAKRAGARLGISLGDALDLLAARQSEIDRGWAGCLRRARV